MDPSFKKPTPVAALTPKPLVRSSGSASSSGGAKSGSPRPLSPFFARAGDIYARMPFPQKLFLWGSTMALSYIGMTITSEETERIELRRAAEAQIEQELAQN